MKTPSPLPAQRLIRGPTRPRPARGGRPLIPTLVLLLVLGACGDGAPPPPGEPLGDDPAAAPADEAPDDGVELLLAVDRLTYAPGDTVQVFLQVANRSDQTRTLTFPTGQRYDLVILDAAGQEVYRWAADRAFTQAVGEEEMAAGQEGPAWEEALPAPTSPGEYRLLVTVPAQGANLRTELPFEVSEDGS